MKDGIYFDVIIIKDNSEYTLDRISVVDMSKTLIDSLMDGLGKSLGVPSAVLNGGKENSES